MRLELKEELYRYRNPAAGGEESLLIRTLWYFTEKFILKSYLNPFSSIRTEVLKLFGAKIGKKVIIKPGVRVKFPWKLIVEDGAVIGEDVWIDNIEKIKIGRNSMISQRVYLCTGNHNWNLRSMPLIAKPININEGAWVAACSVIGPGITIGKNAIIKMGTVVVKDVAPLKDQERWKD